MFFGWIKDKLKRKPAKKPSARSQLILFLVKYGSRWNDLCDDIKVYDHPNYTSLHLVKGERAISMSFEYDLLVRIIASSPGPEETNVDWLSKSGGYKRPRYSIMEFAKVQFPNQYKWMTKNLLRYVNRFKLNKVRRYLAINHEVIDLFVKDQLKG